MVQSVFLLTLANLVMRAVSMLFQVYLSDRIGAAGLGLLQLIMTVHAFAITLGTSGLRVASMYLCAEEYGHRRLSGVKSAMAWCCGVGLILSSIIGLIMILGAKPLALFWVKDLQALQSLRLLGLTLPITCLGGILCGYFTACGKIRQLVIIEIADRIATVFITAILLNRGIQGDIAHACTAIVAGGAIATFGSSVLLLILMLRDLRRADLPQQPHNMGQRLRRFCIPVALNDYLRSGLGTLEQFLIPLGLAKYGGSRTNALADYGTIHAMVFPVLMFLSTVLFSVADLLVPRLARCKATGNTTRLLHITTRCLRASCIFSVAVGGLIFILAKPLGLILYKSESAGHYIQLFAPLLPILYLDCIIDGMHKGLGEQIYCVRVNTLTNFLDVLGLFFLLPRFGIGGYFFTYTTTHVLNFYLSFRRLIKITDIRPSIFFILRIVLIAVSAAVWCTLFFPTSPKWSSIILCGMLYFILVFLLLLLTKKD